MEDVKEQSINAGEPGNSPESTEPASDESETP